MNLKQVIEKALLEKGVSEHYLSNEEVFGLLYDDVQSILYAKLIDLNAEQKLALSKYLCPFECLQEVTSNYTLNDVKKMDELLKPGNIMINDDERKKDGITVNKKGEIFTHKPMNGYYASIDRKYSIVAERNKILIQQIDSGGHTETEEYNCLTGPRGEQLHSIIDDSEMDRNI